MNDTLLVRRLQRVGDLARDRQGLLGRDRTLFDARLQRLAFDQLNHNASRLAGLFDAVDLRNVGVIQRREHMRLTPKPCQAFGIVGECGGQQLDVDTATQLRVCGLIHLSHAAGSEVPHDLVMCEFGSDHGGAKIRGRILSAASQEKGTAPNCAACEFDQRHHNPRFGR